MIDEFLRRIYCAGGAVLVVIAGPVLVSVIVQLRISKTIPFLFHAVNNLNHI